MTNRKLTFTLWDVGHGVSIWINTPNGANHWIDLGRTPEFSPSEHVARAYRVSDIDYLVISHPDKVHLEDLPQFRATFGDPRTFCRNKSLPDADMFGQRAFQYQNKYADLHNRFTASVPHNESPTNPDYNGGVRYGIVKLTDCKPSSAFLHEAKSLNLCRTASTIYRDFGVNLVNLTQPTATR